MGELSRLSELTRFAELTRFLLLFQHYDYMVNELSRLGGTPVDACRVTRLGGTEIPM